MLVDDLSPTALLLLSIITSFGLSAIAYKVFMSKLGTLESILVWYVALAFGIMLAVAIVCMTTQPREPAFYLCVRQIAPWWTLLAAHSLIVVVFIDRKNSSVWANLLGSILVLGAAFLYVLPENQLLLFLAIAGITVPLMTIIHKCNEAKDTNKHKWAPR